MPTDVCGEQKCTKSGIQTLKVRILYIIFSTSRLHPASDIKGKAPASETENAERARGAPRRARPWWQQSGPLVDRAVADPAAQHHTEDHLEDLCDTKRKEPFTLPD